MEPGEYCIIRYLFYISYFRILEISPQVGAVWFSAICYVCNITLVINSTMIFFLTLSYGLLLASHWTYVL